MNQRGFALIGVLMAALVIGLLTMYTTNSLKNSFHATRHGVIIEDIDTLRRMVEMQIDCKATYAANPTACQNGATSYPSAASNDPTGTDFFDVSLYDIGPSPHTVVGGWTISARCADKQLVPFIARGADPWTGKYDTDPLTHQILAWRPLFPASQAICPVTAKIWANGLHVLASALNVSGYREARIAWSAPLASTCTVTGPNVPAGWTTFLSHPGVTLPLPAGVSNFGVSCTSPTGGTVADSVAVN